MNRRMKNKIIRMIAIILIAFIVIALIYFLIKIPIFKSVMNIFVFSLLIAYMLKPAARFLNKWGLNLKIATIVVLITIVLIIIASIVILVPEVMNEAGNLEEIFSDAVNSIEEAIDYMNSINQSGFIHKIIENVYLKAELFLNGFMSKSMEGVRELSSRLLELAVIPVVAYYFITEGESISRKLINLCPLNIRVFLRTVIADIDTGLSKYIGGQIGLALLISILTFGFLNLFGIKFPLVLSLINGVFNIIPYFGPLIGAIPILLVALLGSKTSFLTISIGLYIIQFIEGSIIEPKITGNSVDMHPLTVILILYIGGEAAGFLGMILAVPLVLILKIVYKDILRYS